MTDSHPAVDTHAGDDLLAELADDFLRRHREGEAPSIDEYAKKHPELADRIRDVFPAVMEMERPRFGATLDSAPMSEHVGTSIGRYKLLERIGEGGFGVVYMAEQHHPVRRKVALKLVKPGMDSRQVLARFEAERQALAIMDHPHIAKVFDGGMTDSGRPYFVMELVKGEPITAYCDANHLPPRQRLELFVQVCDAVQHAHQKGIIHRDIKPTNVLVMMHDTTPVVKVIDFGVAKALGQELTEKTLFTGFAQLLGTPLYMSPEQAGQSGLDVDTRSDIYSLGVLLYELLTGTTPFDKERFRAAAQDEIRRIIREEEPPRPSTRLSESKDSLPSISAQRHTEPAKLTKLVRGELDWIVMKALEKDRTRRYETANAFATDVQRYLDDEPVEAWPPSAIYKLRKFARRHRGSLSAAAAIAAVLVLATMISAWQAVRATRAERQVGHERDKAVAAEQQVTHERNQAVAEKQRADEQERATRLHLYATQMNLAQQAWEAADVGRVRQLLEAHWPKSGEEDLRGFEWYHLWQLRYKEGRALPEQPYIVKAMSVARDGRTMAVGSGKRVIFYDASDGRSLGELPPFRAEVRALAFSPDGGRLAVGGGDAANGGHASVWDVGSRRLSWTTHTLAETVLSLAFSPDGRSLAAGTATLRAPDNNPANRILPIGVSKRPVELRLWNADSGADLPPFEGRANTLLSVAFSPDGRTVAAGSWDRTATVWDVETRRQRLEPLKHASRVWSVAFSPDGKLLATGSGDWDNLPELKLWDAQTLAPAGMLQGHRAGITTVAFSSDGGMLASASFDREVRLWDVATRTERNVYRGHVGYVSGVAFAAEDKVVASAGWDKTVKLWNAAELQGESVLTPDVVGAYSYSVAFASDGTHLVSGGSGGAQLIHLPTRKVSTRLTHPGGDLLVVMSPDGKMMATAAGDGIARLWNPQTHELLHELSGHRGQKIWGIAFARDGKTLATGSQDFRLVLWDTATGKQTRALEFAATVRACAFSPDGQQLAVSLSLNTAKGTPGSVRIFDLKTMRQTHVLPNVSAWLEFSPDGSTLARSNWITVELWDARQWQKRHVLRGHVEQVWHLAFSPDGRTLASGSWDGTVKLWHVASGEAMLTLRTTAGVVWGVAFSPDGRTVAASSGQGKDPYREIRLWHAPTGEVTPEPPPPASVLQSLVDRVNVFDMEGKLPELERGLHELLAEQRRVLGDRHEEVARTLTRMVALLTDQKKYTEAALLLRDAQVRNPDDVTLYRDRGNVLCRARRFSDALPEFARAIELDPGDNVKYFRAAPVYLYAGDVDGYRRICREMVQRFQNAEDPAVGERMAKVSLIGSEAQADLDLCARLVQRAVARGESHHLFNWFKMTQGLVEYRRGRYEQAVEAVAGLPENERLSAYGRSFAGLVRTMAHAKAGRRDQARLMLAEVEAKFDALGLKPGVGDPGPEFIDWCFYQLLLPQARSAVNGPPSG